jgi:hypothetical protein
MLHTRSYYTTTCVVLLFSPCFLGDYCYGEHMIISTHVIETLRSKTLLTLYGLNYVVVFPEAYSLYLC